jgi:hypothetical protein
MKGDVEIVEGGLTVEKDIKSLAEISDKKSSMQDMRDIYNTHNNGNTLPQLNKCEGFMAKIDIKTRDYIVESLDENFDVDLIQAIIMRLKIQRRKYWANPNLGSRLYLLRRSKDVPRNRLLAVQYAEEALEDLAQVA